MILHRNRAEELSINDNRRKKTGFFCKVEVQLTLMMSTKLFFYSFTFIEMFNNYPPLDLKVPQSMYNLN